MISVVIALYNSTKYIVEQLDSIRLQSEPVDEVVMVDDASTDETVAVVDSYIKKYNLSKWCLYRHKTNMGFVGTFRDALDKSTGDIIVLCDHDDIWLYDKIRTIMGVFRNDEGVLALNTSFVKIDENGLIHKEIHSPFKSNNGLIRRRVHKKLNRMNLKDVLVYNISPGCTCAIRKDLLSDYKNICENIPHDLCLNILAGIKGGLYYLDVVTTKYRIYQGNTIGLGHEKKLKERTALVQRNLEEKYQEWSILKKCNADEYSIGYIQKVIAVFNYRVDYLLTGNICSFVDSLIKSLQINGLYESVIIDYIARLHK